ncbi:MAG: hypothetical protein ACLUEQ_03745 [Cloacibacillus evryensis]
MSDIEIIRSLFHRDAYLPIIKQPSGKPYVKLVEESCDDSSVVLRNLPEDTVIVKLDSRFRNDNIFSGSHEECSRCDYMIFFNKKNMLNVVYVELKRSGHDGHKIEAQLRGGRVFMKYCQELVRAFLKENSFMAQCSESFIAFGETQGARKNPTRYNRDRGKNSSPDKFMKISYPNTKGVSLEHFLAK